MRCITHIGGGTFAAEFRSPGHLRRMPGTVTFPYRNEIDALRERKDNLEREIAQLRSEQTKHLEDLRLREQQLVRELSDVIHKLGASTRRTLPMLDQVRVA